MARNEVQIDIALETKKARQSIEKLEKQFSDFSKTATKETNKATDSFDVFTGVISASAVESALSSMTSAVISFANSSVKSASQIEGLTSQLTTLTGSAGNAKEIIKDLQEFSARTPFQLPGLAEASKKLLSFGFSQDQIIPKLQQLGDVAAGSGADISELTLIYGQVNAASKLTGERLLQLQERAIPIGPALAKTMGVAETAVKDLVSQGKVDFATFEKAFASLNQEGGKFFEGMIRQSKTFDGVMSTVSDNIGLVQNDIGKGILPTLKTLGVATINLIQNNKELGTEFGKILDIKLNEGIDLILDSIVPLGRAVIFVNDVFVGLATTWDYIKMALNSVVGGLTDATLTVMETARATKEFLGMDTSGLDSAIEKVKMFKEANQEVTQEISNGIDERLRSQKEFKKDVEEIAQKVSVSAKKEIASARETTKVIEEETAKKTQIKTDSAVKELTEAEQIAQKVAEIKKNQSDKIVELKANEILALQEMEEIEKERKEEEKEIKLELDTQEADERLQRLISLLGQEEAIRSEAEARRLAKEGKVAQAKKKRMEADSKAEKQNIFAMKEYENLTQKERVSNLKSTLGTIATLQQSSNKTLVAIGKASAITTATIDGYAAVQKALASAPPPVNFALAGLVGVATAANVAKIAGVSSFENGGVVGGNPQDRDNQFASVASGEVILNRRQQAETLFQIANGGGRGASGDGGLNINIEAGVGGISDEQVDNLINAINDRTEFGNQTLRTA